MSAPEQKANTGAEGTSTSTAPKKDLAATVQTLQFAWYVGHVVTVISTIFYALTYVKVFPRSYKFWYSLALLGVIESFGVLIFQTVKKHGFNATKLLAEDNAQYLFLSVLLFIAPPHVLLTLLVFFLFSTFHVLSYTKHFILPALDIPETHPLSKKIGDFVAANNNKSIQLAALLEVVTLAWLLVRVITFRKRSLTPFLAYALFIKLRYEKSAFTRNYFKQAEIRVENLVNGSGNPAVKDAWLKAKGVFHQVGSIRFFGENKDKAT
ncbi:uncharacterized protein CXQ87_001124 [Candidozyma duobushaemuli]|uniref:Endoplasmic reticulum protein n=2 Tax=Candidozyma TaxID=3303203 RepID=A0ABX8I155_9ASCO|nr:uncharacterized protein CXQ87_001124 [[Candida] duobushaemulonis]PVH18207.1 hypothetical protein CXQ87_001124 [[Candida] duobushaemulonis]QWU86762.1 hypothetical protein CA3LBN_000980 [[Candida] haemuloni]